jgi:hypothetical protein
MSLSDFTLGQVVLHIESGRTFHIRQVGLGIIVMSEDGMGGPIAGIHVPYTAMGQFRAVG